MNYTKLLFLLFILSSTIGLVSAAIDVSIVSPSSGWYNTYNILLNVTTNDYANVTFSTDVYAILTTVYRNKTQGDATLNNTYLIEGSNIIYVYAKNASNPVDLDISGVAGVNIDLSAPTWDQMPSDQVFEYGISSEYDLNASDLQTINYSVNDTSFSIDANGTLTATILSVGEYYLQINATDPFNQVNSTTIRVTVQDTTPPTWDQIPQNISLLYREILSYDLNASDLSGIDSYFINDTSNFTINSSTGLLTNATFLSNGIYFLNISDNDTQGNVLSEVIRIIVAECIEDWVCTEWGSCISSLQTRICSDNNACGTELSKPSESQSCSSGGEKDRCNSYWSCSSWSNCINGMQTRTCTDMNGCGGAVPDTERSCISSLATKQTTGSGGPKETNDLSPDLEKEETKITEEQKTVEESGMPSITGAFASNSSQQTEKKHSFITLIILLILICSAILAYVFKKPKRNKPQSFGF